ncbi:hypothetical protein GCM10009865_32410 [Aeromicrobium ponti]|uniref:Uncharacterized protein n=1 Tax=Cytobacillus oceanisediminis TaxID=665099 RepID=A0A562JRE3_9BACI|nr:hypothetical protein [Cytobacillus oceanisediminis]TWH85739.1 hypothetical protein IQ19_03164 [Cytobacillus oceanisediminis]
MKTGKHSKINNIIPFASISNPNVSSLPNVVVSSSESKHRIEELQTFVEEVMVKGVDYGVVDGFSKPTLLKPGAEKLCDVFGFSKTVKVVNRIEQWEAGIFAYEVKMILTRKDNGVIEAEGLGSCNSKEAAFQQQDAYTIVNTVLKMAKKRALIDAVLSATRSSGIFTQDIENFPTNSSIKGGDEPVTKRQLLKIHQIVAELKMRHEVAKELMQMKYQVDHSTKLSKKQASDFIQDLLHLKDVFYEEENLNMQNDKE